MITRKCTGCGLDKSLDSENFTRDKHDKSGFTYRCKVCRNKASYTWNKANPEKVRNANLKNKAKRKEFYDSEEGKICSRKSWLKKTYNMTLEEYESLLAKQDGKCAICGEQDSKDRWKRLAVDHNHKTGKIRQLLCWKCNSGLGLFNDNKELLTNAIKYLKQHEPDTTM